MAIEEKPKWKQYEHLAYRIQQDLTPNAKVTFDDSIPGTISGGPRQVDISIRGQIAQFPVLIVIECKDWTHPVDAPEVESFIQKLQDIKANIGAMVAANGFTEGALNIARNAEIATFRLLDTESVNWTFRLKIPYLLIGCHLTYKLRFVFHSGVPRFRLESPGDVIAFDTNQVRIAKMKYLVGRKWNSQLIPHKLGTHRIQLSECQYVELAGECVKCDEITVIAEVTETRFYGGLGVEESKGYYDLQEKTLMTKALTLAEICPADIEAGRVPGWKLLGPEEEPPTDPVMTEWYSDAWPESEQDEDLSSPTAPKTTEPISDPPNAETIKFLQI